ncbi:MAG: PQQ-dependent sugar dehydrogenase [Deltaproteobacteria bacterium]|nr:PQQ-dependent sugar dehydrogenase [Deltaproteobacteria bacterium]MBI3388239.1 PQQ-dependent sugar dehydrogenase [Deltaproteobacteria bacterium]
MRRITWLLLAAVLLSVPLSRAQAQNCGRDSADYLWTFIREARLCLTVFVPLGRSCAPRNRVLDLRATRLDAACSAGTAARLDCTGRQAIISAGLTYSSLATGGFSHVCNTSACGNGFLESGEQCDDGNLVNGDGCSATCQLESTTCSDVCAGVSPVSGTAIKAVRVASGLNSPLYVTAPRGDVSRIFIVEQGGAIKILKWGTLLATPFLNLASQIACCGERGLLGVAFHPQYAANGRFFVDYTDPSGNTVVSEYRVSANPDLADSASERIILQVTQPFSNHNGGHIAFGPDNDLYIALGDGGSGGDPLGNGQNSTTLLGKMLRIDVDGAAPYAIPPSNPFVGSPTARPEIWALGLRNPWRNSFDRLTGDLYIADVGQDSFEEVNYQPVGSAGGVNYGWNTVEGNGHCFNPSSGCDQTGLTQPILDYPHGPGDSIGCAVTGGYVYRGCAMPDLRGTYFYGDFCTAFIKTFQVAGGVATNQQDRTTDLAPGGGLSIDLLSSFGEDARGEIYICDLGGEVFKIVPGP